jgi:hypothetical protein
LTALLRRLAITAAATLVLLVLVAAPAVAHGRGSDATNFDSRITDAPDLPGVSWQIYGGDELLQLTNHGDLEVTVLGYDGEPYLRIGPDGVWENQRSPATYLNQERYGRVGVPVHADPDAPPEWERRGDGPSHAWHDHRIHWMSPETPLRVVDVEAPTEVFAWQVEFTAGGEDYALAGELWWVPGPSPWPWLGTGLLLSLPVLAGLATRPRGDSDDERRWPGVARPAAVLLGVMAAANLVGVIDDVAAVPMPLSTAVFAGAQTVLWSGVGLYGAWRGWRGGYADVWALAACAAIVAVGQGLLLVSVLASSQLATLFPDWFPRLLVAASLAQGVVIVTVALVAQRRLAPAPVAVGAEPG